MDISVADCLSAEEWADLRRFASLRTRPLVSRRSRLRFSVLDLAQGERLTPLGRAVLARGPTRLEEAA